MTPSSGLSPAACGFYAELAEHNTRDWWRSQQVSYAAVVKEPLLAVLAELAPRFGPATIFRPYRDRRFAPEAAPYKTTQGAFVSHHEGVGFYLLLSAEGVEVSAGFRSAAPAQLARFRASVDASASGQELVTLLDRLSDADFRITGEQLKTVPRGYPRDHPRAQWLRFRTLTAGSTWAVGAWPGESLDAEAIAARWEPLRPLVDWVVRYAAP